MTSVLGGVFAGSSWATARLHHERQINAHANAHAGTNDRRGIPMSPTILLTSLLVIAKYKEY